MAAENFEGIVRFDDLDGYLAIVANCAGAWQGQTTFRGYDGVRREVQMVARGIADPSPLVRGLLHDVSDVSPPPPSIVTDAVRLLSAQLGRGTGLVFVPNGHVYDWINPPPPPLDQWMHCVPEFGDRRSYDAAIADVAGGAGHVSCTLSVKLAGSDWIEIDVDLYHLASMETSRVPQCLIQVSPR